MWLLELGPRAYEVTLEVHMNGAATGKSFYCQILTLLSHLTCGGIKTIIAYMFSLFLSRGGKQEDNRRVL